MSKYQKAVDRLCSNPKDYTYTEARNLLTKMGFVESNKGKTSGSRVKFYRESDGAFISFHKPHPGDIMREYAVKELINLLEGYGDL